MDFYTVLRTFSSNDEIKSHLTFLKNTNNLNQNDLNLVLKIADCHDINMSEILLEFGANPDTTDPFLNTLLIINCKRKYNNESNEIIKILLENGANPNFQNSVGKTALMYASERKNNTDIVELLIKYKANLNIYDINQNTALIYAVMYDNIDALKLLIKAGANINHKDTLDWTSVNFAIQSRSPESLKLLLENGADINRIDNNSDSPLIHAIYFQDVGMVKMLLSMGANVFQYKNILKIARRQGQPNEIINLIKNYINMYLHILKPKMHTKNNNIETNYGYSFEKILPLELRKRLLKFILG
jgi:ankyrin repeat protein